VCKGPLKKEGFLLYAHMEKKKTELAKRKPTVVTKPFVEIDLEKLEQLASRGLTFAQITSSLGIGESTFYAKKAKNKEIQDAVKRGRDKGVAEVSNALFKSALKGNVTAQIFFLCNKDKENWQNVNKIEHSGADGSPLSAPTINVAFTNTNTNTNG